MNNLIAELSEYTEISRIIINHAEEVQNALETFLIAMKAVRWVGAEDGALVEVMDTFIEHIELCVYKPCMYANELVLQIQHYAEGIDSADKPLH